MNYQKKITVTAGTSGYIILPKDLRFLPLSVQIVPNATGSVAAYASCDKVDDIEASNSGALWTALDPTTVTVSTIIQVNTPVMAFKFTATTADATIAVMCYETQRAV